MINKRSGAAQRVAPGEVVCGDAYAIIDRGDELTIALADGLGHGPEAARAASRFCDHVRANVGAPVLAILRGAHAALAGTRGAAAAIVRIDLTRSSMSFTGVGNIELRAMSREPIAPVCTAGIVGSRLKQTHEFTYGVSRGDVLVIFSDGIKGVSDLTPLRELSPDTAASALLATFATGKDDATCIVVKL